MNQKIKLIVIILVFAVLLGGAYVLYTQLGEQFTPEQLSTQPPQTTQSTTPADDGQTQPQQVQAPDFTVYDIQGNAVRLSDFFGKPIVLNFWASWCGPCQMEMPDFQEKFQELGKDIRFLMVNMTDGDRETVEIASTFIVDKQYTFPVFFDTESDAAITYGVYSLPTTFFIDADGNAVAQATGAINADTLQKGIDMITK
jgi:thiol-disulfide isomerase/thioredoxin